MDKDGERTRGKILLPSAMMAVVGLLVGSAVGPVPLTGAIGILQEDAHDALRIGPGDRLVVHEAIRAETLHVDGILEAGPGTDLVIHATSIVLGPAAVLRAGSGEQGGPTLAVDAHGRHGTDGHDVVVYASFLEAAPGALIRAGDGGGGGDAIGRGNVTAGDGGAGGDIHLHVEALDATAFLLPGGGGHGGDARGFAVDDVPGATVGGAGGHSGLPFHNSVLIHDVSEPLAVAASILAGRFAPADLCLIMAPFLDLGQDCLNLPLPVLTTATAATLSVPCDTKSKTCDLHETGTLVQELADVIGLPGDFGACNTPRGTPGTSGLDGGPGGAACTFVQGARGGDGGKGSDGNGNCGAGGAGMAGGQGAGTPASGGAGGQGYRHGGDGGSASAGARGGDGGNGGRGGINHWGANCPGGPGGPGGSGLGGTATGGAGGAGLCGHGGQGGSTSSPGEGGSGGAGGSGNPAGAGGAAGSGTSGSATAGKGGEGLGVCPAQL